MTRIPLIPIFIVLMFVLILPGCDRLEPAGQQTTAQEPAPGAVPETAEPASEAVPGTASDASPSSANGGAPKSVVVMPANQAGLDWLDSDDAWGGLSDDPALGVPYLLFTALNPRWQVLSSDLTVQRKKQLFYRFMLPLVLHANKMIRERRARVVDIQSGLAGGQPLTPVDTEFLRHGLVQLRVASAEEVAELTADTPELAAWLDEVLVRLDEVPAGLALGQAAYESGYGTSRFAVQGNALFGQWTYNGEGIKPEEQRSALGDHRIASFDWPFDSVRGYFINLMSHPSYDAFRQLRAQQRAAGEPLDSMVLADGLLSYSERGQAYVDDLKGIISYNDLDRADQAVLRDEPMRFVVTAEDDAEVAAMEAELDEMRANGELQAIYERMRLD